MSQADAHPGPFSVLGIKLRNAVFRRYSKRGAKRYDKHRQGSRWNDEVKLFERIFRRLAPKTVLDCPVGTGRWFYLYREIGAKAVGVDLSQHMLDEAKEKITPDDHLTLKRVDLLDPAAVKALGRFDLIVCWRFAYWLRQFELQILAANLAATGSKALMIGANTALESTSPGRLRLRTALKRLQGRVYRRVWKRVYTEAVFLGIMEKAGWRLYFKEIVRTTRTVNYTCYVFGRENT